ncbi:hypothetical protein [Brevundimonas sp. M20]|uniref:hypothetical protein n=1 Tax=Brevundimonas sp. M20 TaxID=2591463 RepID=UPI001147A3EF|nr:hypothetical protein [Brevundimonas sp. M20]QDH74519.1 hypothetical protein FKQ52_14475 [Brevundimonas sp. M20]
MLSLLLVLAVDPPTLDRARTCQAHVELLMEDAMREVGQVAGPTWFIRDWWNEQAEAAGAPGDDSVALAARKEALNRLRLADPEAFQTGRGGCVDTAIDAGAVPGMARVRPGD